MTPIVRLALLVCPVALAQLALPPNHPSLKTLPGPGQPLRVLVFGDFGSPRKICVDHSNQKRIADAMFASHQEGRFHMGITVGDNFYDDGVRSLDDKHWKCSWDDMYQRFGIPFFATLGNHDTRGKPEVQVQRSGIGGWWMPARYYSYAVGPVRFIAMDTDEGTTESPILFRLPVSKPFSQAQLDWVDRQLASAKEPWKIVYGHHPIFSSGMHGDESRPAELAVRLLPILKRHKVDLFVAGHDHHMQHIEHDGIQFFISGGGGQELRNPNKRLPAGVQARETRKLKAFGYVTLEVTEKTLVGDVVTLGKDGKTNILCRKELSK